MIYIQHNTLNGHKHVPPRYSRGVLPAGVWKNYGKPHGTPRRRAYVSYRTLWECTESAFFMSADCL